MTRKFTSIIIAAMGLLTAGCHSIADYDNTAAGNFDLLWRLFDEHYCFFAERGVDWDSVYRAYAPRAANAENQEQLFDVCASMADELRDGHVNVSSWFNTSYYKKWWSDYPQNYDARVVEQYYLHFNYRQLGPVTYGILEQNVGYMHISTFSSGIGASNMDAILNWCATCSGMIIDVRNNGGGGLDNVETYVAPFLKGRTLVGYMQHKTGPGHDDFSGPYAYYYDQPGAGHFLWGKPVIVLTNRSTFSAANNYVSIMACLDGVRIVGATTGGGSGMPMSYELPCGWGVRMSAAPIRDARGRLTDQGVEPSPGCAVNISPDDTAAGRDPIIDRAVALLTAGN